ncbi:energy-coupling factor transporter transmembrane component T family protein [Amycolatopsis suaedae]|uniref:Energy-coupling factor transporter transmembrane protein EcfT n=1 Tax=Amycolatopsis suaedae TaxID=2510978 RepID=A0A4Q7JBU2_9PSEU|nr:energy-coupling factor transporter transmembrane component T [Amycolatopsis suaedae]RZQ65301.1 energy-coupling factor transporter transmembrane protein EcfT [Amycolatopsis suaedae]
MLARTLHPAAWWVWALGLAVAASRTTNPFLLGLIIAVAAYVVTSRRGDAPWALAFRLYVWLGVFIVVMRVLFRILVGGLDGGHVLFELPEIPLPDIAAGITLLGPTSAEELLGGFYDGLRLATMVICIGAANALANPKRMLKAVPGALYEVGTAVTVALSVAPQLVESVQRVRKARRLRAGRRKGMRALRGIVIPVLSDAMDRSLLLAAAMDSRGYGRRNYLPLRLRVLIGVCVLAGLVGVCVGVYGVLDGTSTVLGVPMLLAGMAVAGIGFVLGGRRVRRSVYRPDPWRWPETAVVCSGAGAAALLMLTSGIDPGNLYPSLSPLGWPELSPVHGASLLVGLLPAWLAPRPLPVTEAVA